MRIKCAAIRTKSGQIFEGKNHSECYKSAKSAGIDRLVSLRSDNGFMTEWRQVFLYETVYNLLCCPFLVIIFRQAEKQLKTSSSQTF